MRKTSLIILISVLPLYSFSQDSIVNKGWQLRGNISNLLLLTLNDQKPRLFGNDDLWEDYILLGRIQCNVQALPWLDMEVSLRNMTQWGQSLNYVSGLPIDVSGDRLGLNWTVSEDRNFQWKQNIDRAWLRIKKGKFEATAGKQRINWSQTFAWNPNDIFNTYSFYDVDYPERPGTDALRLQYFATPTSAIEVAVKWDANDNISYAALYRWNIRTYDIQVLAGRLEQNILFPVQEDKDWFAGAGWSGEIGSLAFRGETCWFIPADDKHNNNSVFEVSAGLDYTFSNSLMIQGELFYNQGASAEDYFSLWDAPLTPKRLSFSEINALLQSSYPFTPLLTGTLALAWFPDLNGYYVFPSVEYSVSNNLDLGFYIQMFRGTYKPESGYTVNVRFTRGVLRLNYSF